MSKAESLGEVSNRLADTIRERFKLKRLTMSDVALGDNDLQYQRIDLTTKGAMLKHVEGLLRATRSDIKNMKAASEASSASNDSGTHAGSLEVRAAFLSELAWEISKMKP